MHVSKNIPTRWHSFLNKMKKETHKKQFDIKVLNELEDLNTTKLKTHYVGIELHRNLIQSNSRINFAMQRTTDNKNGLSKEQAEVINQFFF